MQKIETSLPGVLLLEPKVFGDARGFFMETYHAEKFRELGIDCDFVQDNHSLSRRGTLRGLHYQIENPQAKLCRVIRGEVLDIAVDIRVGSPHFGKWVGAILSAENKRQIFVPRGFAHGFFVLSDEAEFLYKCDNFYKPSAEMGVLWNDPQIGIDWQIPEGMEILLSEKDKRNSALSEINAAQLPRLEI
jgi:dTDP-4-dehydrorhamnose 3,5-epimerase